MPRFFFADSTGDASEASPPLNSRYSNEAAVTTQHVVPPGKTPRDFSFF